MPFWAWAAVAVGIFVLALILFLFLFRVRYRLEWEGWRVSAVLEYGFPGLMRTWRFPFTSESEAEPAEPESTESAEPSPQTSQPAVARSAPKSSAGSQRRKERLARWKARARRASIAFIKDSVALRALFAYGWRFARLTFKLLRPEVEASVGHPDPAFLGRLAGYWYAGSPLLRTRRVRVNFRFQDQRRTWKLSVQGGFSAARVLGYAFALLATFPLILCMRRAWRGWRNS